jgi:type I restriction enzyme S subunit
MSEWKEYKLGDLGTVVTGKTPSKNNPEDWGDEMPFVTPSDYKNYGKFAKRAERNLSKIGIERLKNKILPIKSILVTCIGSDMGKVAINSRQVITNQQINSIIPNSKTDSDFLYYRLVSMYETLRIYGGDGTAVPIVNKGDFENIETELPPLPEQTAIANVLSSLDNKIDLLHRQNTTLEKMAETLFRQWFVEEAKEEWESDTLGNLFDIGIGRTPPRKVHHWFSENPTDIKWVSIKDMGTSGVYISSVSEYLTQDAVNRFSIPIIPENTVMLSFKMTIGRLVISTENMLSMKQLLILKLKRIPDYSLNFSISI